jgi:tRNA(Ile)-lysidine synthase
VEGKRVCVALSGGMDSVVLLDAVDQLKATLRIDLHAVHVHHGLSPNADAWAAFCAEICAARHIALTTTSVHIDKDSSAGLEGAARAARYAAFADEGSLFVLLAQHADDQAETVLHQLLRGTGLKGLAGMGEARIASPTQTLLRPLLGVSRGEIEAFAKERGLKWIEDESNDDIAFTRNFLRHEITPLLAERFPHYRASLARAARHASEADVMLAELAKIDLRWDGENAFAETLDSLPSARQINALYHWLGWQKVSAPSQAQLAEWAAQLFRSGPTDKPQLAGGHDFVIRRTNNRLLLLPNNNGNSSRNRDSTA